MLIGQYNIHFEQIQQIVESVLRWSVYVDQFQKKGPFISERFSTLTWEMDSVFID